METLRIAVVVRSFPPDRLHLQPWRYLCELASHLRAAGHDVRFLTNDGEGEWKGIPIVRHVNGADFEDGRAVRRLVRAQGLDGGLLRLTARLFLSMHGTRTVDSEGGRLVGILLRPLYRWPDLRERLLDPTLLPEIRNDLHHVALLLSRQLGTWPASRHVVSRYAFLWESDRETAVAAGLPPDACSTIPHPFDPFFLSRQPTEAPEWLAKVVDPAKRRVVFTGPPEACRGVGEVLRLPRLLDSSRPTQVLALLRDPSVPFGVTRGARGPHELVVVSGQQPPEAIRAAYRASDAAVFPYRWVRTGLPLVLLEAVASGLPVVTTRVHPLRELEGRTGLVFAKRGDVRNLAKAVDRVLGGEDRQEIERRNRAWIESVPDWRRVADAYAALLR